MTNVQVQCFACKGSGEREESCNDPTDHTAYRMVVCKVCNGFGAVIATELKAVTAWAQITRDVPSEK